MPEWRNLTWGESTWGDPVSLATRKTQSLFGGDMPWEEVQLQASERHSEMRVFAVDNPTSLIVLAEIQGVDASSSLTKTIRDGIIEEQKLSLVISDAVWAEYYLHGGGASHLQVLKYLIVEQVIETTNSLASVPIGIFRVSTIPQTSDDGQGLSLTIEAEDWMASNLRTPFPVDTSPYTVLVNRFEGAIDINNVPSNEAPRGITPERLALGHSIFGAESNWYHNFFGYIWNFMMDITNERFIVDPSIIFSAHNCSKMKVAAPEVVGVTIFQKFVAAPLENVEGQWIPTTGAGGSSGGGVTVTGEFSPNISDNNGPITPVVEANVEGTPEQQFGLLSFPEGPSIISYLRDLIAIDSAIASHSGIKGTYFVYDATGSLHWRSWDEISDADLVFAPDGSVTGKISLPVESIQTSVKEPQYNHFIVRGFYAPPIVETRLTFNPGIGGGVFIGPDVLPPPDGYQVYGELQDGHYWSSSSTISITDGTIFEIPPGGLDITFPFMEHLGFGATRFFDDSYIVATPGSTIAAAFYGYSSADTTEEGAHELALVFQEIFRDVNEVIYHFENGNEEDSIFLISWWLHGTVWAPLSLWTNPELAPLSDEDRWVQALTSFNHATLNNYVDQTFATTWYTYPGLRDRTVTIYLGEDYNYITMPRNVHDQPLDPTVVNSEMGKFAHMRLLTAVRFFFGQAFTITLTLDSAFSFVELGKAVRIKYPRLNIDGYFVLIGINMPFSEQAQTLDTTMDSRFSLGDEEYMPKLDESKAYAEKLAQNVKSYIDMMLAPFLGSRVQIYVALALKVDAKNEVVKISVDGNEYDAVLGANQPPNIKKYPHVRVLFDSRTRIFYYDDVVPEKYLGLIRNNE